MSPQLTMKALGHLDVRTTMKHYTDLRISDTAKAIATVPTIAVQVQPVILAATGTGGMAPKRDQHLRQQSGGFSSLTLSPAGTGGVASPGGNRDADKAISALKSRAIDTFCHILAPRDLPMAGRLAKLSNSRAVGAVG